MKKKCCIYCICPETPNISQCSVWSGKANFGLHIFCSRGHATSEIFRRCGVAQSHSGSLASNFTYDAPQILVAGRKLYLHSGPSIPTSIKRQSSNDIRKEPKCLFKPCCLHDEEPLVLYSMALRQLKLEAVFASIPVSQLGNARRADQTTVRRQT